MSGTAASARARSTGPRDERRRRCTVREGRAGRDEHHSGRRQTEPVEQPADQIGDFGAVRAPIEICLVEDQEKRFVGMRFEKGPRVGEDVALDRAQQHIFEHRIVGDEEVGARRLDFVPGEQFGILEPLDRPQRIAIGILPMRAWLAVPVAQPIEGPEKTLGLARPAALFPQCCQQRLVLGVAAARTVLDLEIILERLEPLLVAVPVANPGVERAPGVASELRRTLGRSGEPFADRGRSKQGPQPAQLVIHQRVHRVEQQRPHRAGGEMLGSMGSFVGEPREHRQQETLCLSRAGARRDDDAGPAGVSLCRDFKRLRLMFVGRVEEELVRLLRRHSGQERADLRVNRQRSKRAITDIGRGALDIGGLRDAAAGQQVAPKINNLGVRKVVGSFDVRGERLTHMLDFSPHATPSTRIVV